MGRLESSFMQQSAGDKQDVQVRAGFDNGKGRPRGMPKHTPLFWHVRSFGPNISLADGHVVQFATLGLLAGAEPWRGNCFNDHLFDWCRYFRQLQSLAGAFTWGGVALEIAEPRGARVP